MRKQFHFKRFKQKVKPVQMYSEAGRVVAAVEGDCLHKSIQGSRHMLRKPRAICFDKCVLEQAERAGAVRVEVLDKDDGSVYRASLRHVRRYGLKVNRGYGEQIALPLKRWNRTAKGQPVQMSLLGL